MFMDTIGPPSLPGWAGTMGSPGSGAAGVWGDCVGRGPSCSPPPLHDPAKCCGPSILWVGNGQVLEPIPYQPPGLAHIVQQSPVFGSESLCNVRAVGLRAHKFL